MPVTDSNYPGAIDNYQALMAAEVQPLLTNKSIHMRKGLGGVTAIEITLGVNPQGSQADVAARFTANEADIAAAVASILTKVSKTGDSMQGNLTLDPGVKLGVERSATPQASIHVGPVDTAGSVGTRAIILGDPHITNNVGNHAVIEGSGCTASGDDSHAEGVVTEALGSASHAEGISTQAFFDGSHAEGVSTQAFLGGTHAEGFGTQAVIEGCHAEGLNTIANADNAHAEGSGSIAAGISSHAEGMGTGAVGVASHAEGNTTQAIGNYSHSEGQATMADGDNSHAGGLESNAFGLLSYAWGSRAIAGHQGSRVVVDSQNIDTSSDIADQNKLRFMNGFKFVKGGIDNNLDGPEYSLKQETVGTRDATPTALQDILVPTDSVMLVEARVLGRRTAGLAGADGDSATYVVSARFKNIGGVVTVHDVQQSFVSEDQAAWDVTWIVNVLNAELQVTGAADNNVTWDTTTKVQRLF